MPTTILLDHLLHRKIPGKQRKPWLKPAFRPATRALSRLHLLARGRKPFFARYDDKATWLSDLKPAFGKSKFFYEDELQGMLSDEFRNTISKEKKRVGGEQVGRRSGFEY